MASEAKGAGTGAVDVAGEGIITVNLEIIAQLEG
jgi:hypothetical protein